MARRYPVPGGEKPSEEFLIAIAKSEMLDDAVQLPLLWTIVVHTGLHTEHFQSRALELCGRRHVSGCKCGCTLLFLIAECFHFT